MLVLVYLKQQRYLPVDGCVWVFPNRLVPPVLLAAPNRGLLAVVLPKRPPLEVVWVPEKKNYSTVGLNDNLKRTAQIPPPPKLNPEVAAGFAPNRPPVVFAVLVAPKSPPPVEAPKVFVPVF